MLNHLGHPAAARRILAAIEATTADGITTPDLGGQAHTDRVTEAIIARLSPSGGPEESDAAS